MSLTYRDLQDEVKRRGIMNQGGTQFDPATKNIINTSLFRVSREALWRPLRRKITFDTVIEYTTGTGAATFTNGSKNITVTGATFITDGIRIGRRIKISGENAVHVIKTITGETTLTIEKNYAGTTTSTGTYSILGQEEYVLPAQVSHRMFMWHEAFAGPTMLTYIPDQEFYGSGGWNTNEGIPTHYRMWGEDMVNIQVLEPSVISISSSSALDTSISCTVFGVVSGYADSEIIITNSSDGTVASVGSKSFSAVERIAKSASSIGRITATANTGNAIITVLPVGDTTSGILYSKVQLCPIPSSVFPINVQYYKDPYRMVNDGDVHELGQDFDEAIILLAAAKLKMENNQQEGDKFMLLYQDEVRSLRRTNVDKIDMFLKLYPSFGGRSDMVTPYLSARQAGPYFTRSGY